MGMPLYALKDYKEEEVKTDLTEEEATATEPGADYFEHWHVLRDTLRKVLRSVRVLRVCHDDRNDPRCVVLCLLISTALFHVRDQDRSFL